MCTIDNNILTIKESLLPNTLIKGIKVRNIVVGKYLELELKATNNISLYILHSDHDITNEEVEIEQEALNIRIIFKKITKKQSFYTIQIHFNNKIYEENIKVISSHTAVQLMRKLQH